MSPPVVLVAGESLVDVLTAADGSRTELPGGSPANVAVALARLGTRVRLLTAYAPDRLGAVIEEYVAEPGLELAADPHVVARTSTAVASLDAAGSATYAFDLSGELPALPPTTPPTTPPVHLHLGSLAALLPPGADLLAELVERLAPTTTVSYDINARPTAVPLDDAARARIDGLVRASDLVKASDEDLVEWRPGVDVDAAAAALVEGGAGVVVITLGGAGARCYTSEGLVARVPGAAVTVRDTIGAGDVFCATLLDTLRRDGLLGADRRSALRGVGTGDWERILERANRAASITVSREGAQAPTLAELDAP